MKDTLVNRKWKIHSQSENQVIAKLKHRAFDATVTLQSVGSIIKILNEATRTNSQTKEVKPGVPMGWLKNVQKDLRSNLLSAG